MRCLKTRTPRRLGIAVLAGGMVLGAAGVATADRSLRSNFEPPIFAVATIDGQQGWANDGAFDATVAPLASFASASGFGFGLQALRISDATTRGSFSNQTFSPGLASPAGESAVNRHFEASFSIGTTKATEQSGLHMSVSPDDGFGARMSYLRFEDQPDGVHVFFDDVTDPGPLGTVASFNETDVATLTRAAAHRITFSLDFKQGLANDVVRIFIDGKLVRVRGTKVHRDCRGARHEHSLGRKCAHHSRRDDRRSTGTTWEDYYRFDPEQLGSGNTVPMTSKLLFRESGTANIGNLGQGFLIDDVTLLSSNVPKDRRDCRQDGWMTHTRADGSPFVSRRACIKYVKRHHDDHARH